ncbi:MAG TPA: hypothetical protein VIK65_10995 [Candidatus Limnocylindrales bacterium]
MTHGWVGLALTAGILAACGSDAEPTPSSSGPSGGATRDGVVVTISLDRSTLTSGELSSAVVTVENQSRQTRIWQGGRCNLPAAVWIDTAADVSAPVGRDWPGAAGHFKDLVLPESTPGARGTFVVAPIVDASTALCPASRGVNQLAPGRRLQLQATWAGEVNGVAAPAGPAVVTASFAYLGSGPVHDPSPVDEAIQAQVSVDVAASPARLLGPGEAIDAALADPAFAAWVAGAGAISTWQGAELQPVDGAYAVILTVRNRDGRATVDRRSGAVSFEVRATP